MALAPRAYTQQELEDLIGCSKIVSEPPKEQMKPDRGHLRNDMRLKSVEGDREFRVFLRRSADLPENFSIGLVYLPTDGTGEVTLLRCNGPHGSYSDSFDPEHPHWDCHVHRATAQMIEAGLRPEKEAAVSEDFASFEEAVHYFLRVTNVQEGPTYFPKVMQGLLPFEEEPGP